MTLFFPACAIFSSLPFLLYFSLIDASYARFKSIKPNPLGFESRSRKPRSNSALYLIHTTLYCLPHYRLFQKTRNNHICYIYHHRLLLNTDAPLINHEIVRINLERTC